MQVNANGTSYQFIMEGAISEKSELYIYDIRDAKNIDVDMEKVTFINSIGVKNWIFWTAKIPSGCAVRLHKCPFVIISQVNMVLGFLPKGARIESFYAPYISDDGDEVTLPMLRGRDYEYGQSGQAPKVNFPLEYVDPKTKKVMEPDFVVEKVSKFLHLG